MIQVRDETGELSPKDPSGGCVAAQNQDVTERLKYSGLLHEFLEREREKFFLEHSRSCHLQRWNIGPPGLGSGLIISFV